MVGYACHFYPNYRFCKLQNNGDKAIHDLNNTLLGNLGMILLN